MATYIPRPSAFQHAKTQRVAAGRALWGGGCGFGLHESDVRRCPSCNQGMYFDAGEECMSRGGLGVGGVDACSACMDQHCQCCGACGDDTHEDRDRLMCACTCTDDDDG
jgi:hypothetical protein